MDAQDPPGRAELLSSLEAAAPGWDELAEAAANPFGTWAWCDAWWRRYGAGRELAILRVRDGDRLAAILPLYRADRGPVRMLRFLGHGAADLAGPLCAPQDRPLAAAALRDAAAALGPRGVLLAERVAGDEGLAAALGGRVVRTEPTPVLEIGGRTWDDWLGEKSSNFRGQVRRMERKLAREHELAFRMTTDPAALDADLRTLFDLHDARWEQEGGTAAFSEDRRAFHADFARRALDAGLLRLWIADVDGRPGAAWYGLRHAGRDWYYQFGRDPQWDRFKLGFVLLTHTVRDAFESGMTAYHFGLGGEEYKDRFATGDPGLDTFLAGHRLPVRAAAAAIEGARRLPDGPRKLVARRTA